MEMKRYLNQAVYDVRRSAIRQFSRLAAETPGCIRLTLGEPDFPTPARISEMTARALKEGDTHYIENNGSAVLREKIAAYEASEHGLHYSPEEIIVTAGATEALFVSLFGILNPGDEVIVPSPAFMLYGEIASLCRAKTVYMDTRRDGFQIRREALRQAFSPNTKAIILNSPNNPTGVVYDQESLQTVREAVSGRPVFVICDDVYRGLCFNEDSHSFAEYRDMKEQILAVQSFSKPYAMTGWRMGYLMAHASVKERMELIHQYDIVSTPAPFQKACIQALQEESDAMREEYRRRAGFVTAALTGMGMELTAPSGAFYVFPSIRRFGMPSEKFCTRLIREAGVAVTPGAAFGADDHIRISCSCCMDDLKEAMQRLERFVDGLDK